MKIVKIKRTLTVEYTIEPPEEDVYVVANSEQAVTGEELYFAIAEAVECGTCEHTMTNVVTMVDSDD
jgi:hypothetical protein